MKKRNIYLDYSIISLKLDVLSEEIKQGKFDAIVILLRGGAFVGMHMAFLTGLPYHFIKYDRANRAVIPIGQLPPSNSRILLCEDFAGSGSTLIDCKRFLLEAGYSCTTLVVCQDLFSATIPDYCCFQLSESNARFILPWERFMLNANEVLFNPGHADHAYEHTAWDMDGVFLKDVDSIHYQNSLENALALRDTFEPAPFAPNVSDGDMIVTGRPVIDRERTLQWLHGHNINIPVIFFRDDGVDIPSAESTARWKGQRALELGFTHYVESDASQAAYMAALYPELRVTWWNEGNPIQLQAAGSSNLREMA